MTFNAKDSVVFTFDNKKYMIDNVKNVHIEKGQILMNGPAGLVYIGENTQYS